MVRIGTAHERTNSVREIHGSLDWASHLRSVAKIIFRARHPQLIRHRRRTASRRSGYESGAGGSTPRPRRGESAAPGSRGVRSMSRSRAEVTQRDTVEPCTPWSTPSSATVVPWAKRCFRRSRSEVGQLGEGRPERGAEGVAVALLEELELEVAGRRLLHLVLEQETVLHRSRELVRSASRNDTQPPAQRTAAGEVEELAEVRPPDRPGATWSARSAATRSPLPARTPGARAPRRSAAGGPSRTARARRAGARRRRARRTRRRRGAGEWRPPRPDPARGARRWPGSAPRRRR